MGVDDPLRITYIRLIRQRVQKHQVILWSQGQAESSVQSQNVEGWAIETLLQYETIRDVVYRKIDMYRKIPIRIERYY